MVKVNLLGNTVVAAETMANASAQSNSQRQALVNIILVALIPGGAYYYSTSQIAELTTQRQKLETQQTDLANQINMFKADEQLVAGIQAEVTQYTARVEAYRSIAKKRVENVRALDTLQTLLPEPAVLNSVQVAGSRVQIKGHTNTQDEISEILKAFESSHIFRDVVLRRSVGQTGEKNARVLTFDIEMVLSDEVDKK